MKPAIQITRTGLVIAERHPAHRLVALIDSALRGVGQVMFQDNTYTGLLFLAGLGVNAPFMALYAFAGALISSAVASLAGAETQPVRQGLFGFNGALVGIALPMFLPMTSPAIWLWLAGGAAASTFVLAFLMRLLAPWNAPALTAPFVFVTWAAILSVHALGHIPAAAPPPPALDMPLWQLLPRGLFNGVAQVFLQENPVTGALFALGLLVNAPAASLAALLGSASGLLIALALQVPAPTLAAGSFGFNGALVAIAVGHTFAPKARGALFFAAAATILTPWVQLALSAALAPVHLPVFTFPFVLTTWVFLLGMPVFFDRSKPPSV